MKLLITGSREASAELKSKAIRFLTEFKNDDLEILVGDADGIDAVVIEFCDAWKIPVKVFGAFNRMRRETKTGVNIKTKGDYPARDRVMGKLCDQVLAFWDGQSPGTIYTYNYTTGELNKKGTLVR